MNVYTTRLKDIDKSQIELVGGKAANLGELFKMEGILVPDGFCVTTGAYKAVTGASALFNALVEKLCQLNNDNRQAIIETSASIRQVIESLRLSPDIEKEISAQLKHLGADHSYAIRSSATAEDLPTVSFAGQHDSYLNIIGEAAIFNSIIRCWASLYSERSVFYRVQNGFDHSKVSLGVIVQHMLPSQVSGIMFTADPVNGNRKVLSIDAGFGLGEALVSGIVNADNYKIRSGNIIEKKIAAKQLAIRIAEHGGTIQENIAPGSQQRPALIDEQLLELERLGRITEAHFGKPQDIEWCLVANVFYLVQSRAITTLFPIPVLPDKSINATPRVDATLTGALSEDNRVFISVGHQQMMTDAMKPLGLSFWLLMTPPKTRTAAGRLFVDVTSMLSAPASRNTILNTLGKFDPLIRDALTTILDRDDFIKLLPPVDHQPSAPLPPYEALNEFDPTIVSRLITRSENSLVSVKQAILTKTGSELFDFILEDIALLKQETANPESFGVIMTGMNAAAWINEKMNEWLGEKNVADTIAQSVSGNITSQMGLDILDVADTIRGYPAVIAFLEKVREENFLDQMLNLEGGHECSNTINNYLIKYGMRCAGEIDITRNRWSEKPATILPLILTNIKSFQPGEAGRRYQRGLEAAQSKEQEVLQRLKQLPGGEQKTTETKRMIDLVRNYAGYREYPKYAIISRYFVYKQAILREAKKLIRDHAGDESDNTVGTLNNDKVFDEPADIYYLNFEELKEVFQTKKPDYAVISERKQAFNHYQKLIPPRVITSEGEMLTGKYNRGDIPANAIPGLAVSAGTVEGPARVVLGIEDADLQEGDILVTRFTDPSWTPIFVFIKGLVTEVGGLMTHGAVIAREYGLPAVVGVDNATRLINDGDIIRVNGTDGYIEIISRANE